MAVVINGSGTVTGLAVGGLPDGTVDAGTLADDAVGLAQMASGTDGNLITYDASGDPAAVAVGTSGQVLTSNGAGAAPTMQAGGKVLQVVSTTKTDAFTTSSTSFTDITGLSLSITPSSTSSKVLVHTVTTFSNGSTGGYASTVRLMRDTTAIGNGTGAGNRPGAISTFTVTNPDTETVMTAVTSFLDSPSTTSAVTYKPQILARSGTTAYVNMTGNDRNDVFMGRFSSTITLMEIGA